LPRDLQVGQIDEKTKFYFGRLNFWAFFLCVVVAVCYAATFRVVFLFVYWFWIVFCWRLACGV
jgi:hypothetical protein